ncbi:lycopene cyclase domain-containing protein [Frankia sp. AgKG'84/4]|uniref:lycopene cyclase domain-containing protein n=1 Tax=Frankia sp. AgKG'84/4 TaxID=573490 RepID=UPI00200ED1F2|nr:lycopene cyclase domain-containing protein [Frankia sp. AgKG'84/4]MCL9797770.1 lycopene cyclase domain-containing protein [Frankia sp. AgKG'84/4]
MRHLSYLAVLAGCLLGTAPLELLLATRVYGRPRRLALTLLPVLAVFVAWDLYAISAGHWTFDARGVTGLRLPGRLPLDELLFFLVVPLCAILTLEAVRSVRGWPAGDEPPRDEPAPDDPAPDDPAPDNPVAGDPTAAGNPASGGVG